MVVSYGFFAFRHIEASPPANVQPSIYRVTRVTRRAPGRLHSPETIKKEFSLSHSVGPGTHIKIWFQYLRLS